MKSLDRVVQKQASPILSRAMLLESGATDKMIKARLSQGVWSHPHPGVYVWGPLTGGWLERLSAALAAAGPEALVSHRAAFVLWGLEGIDTHLVELTVPYECGPVPEGVVRHRTRREMPREIVRGLPATSIDRTLLDVADQVPVPVLRKGIDCALRNDLTSLPRLWKVSEEQGGRGVPGSGRFRRTLTEVSETGASGSPAEIEILAAMRKGDIPDPVLQWEVRTPSGRRYLVDFGWPDLAKGVEIDGLAAHAGSEALERDLVRQNDLLDTGIELRRFTARAVRRSPESVVEAIRRFLAQL